MADYLHEKFEVADAVMNNDASEAAPVHAFDPDASPEEKGAQASQGKEQLESIVNVVDEQPVEPARGGSYYLFALRYPPLRLFCYVVQM